MIKTKSVNILDVSLPKFNIREDGDGITQGLIMIYLKCRREFVLRLNEWGLEEPKYGFANGSLTHDTLDKIYTYFILHNKIPSFTKIKKWIDEYGNDEKTKNWLPQKETELKKIMKAVCYVILTEYIRFYKKKDFGSYELLGAENVFDNTWKGFRLRGKKDLRLRINGKKWTLETKTSGRIEEDDLSDKIAFDFQSQFYNLNEEIEYGEPVIGTIYNVIRNPGHKLGEGETLFQFCNRLRRDIRKRPKHFFKRWSIPYSRLDKMLFKRELLYKLEEIDNLLHGRIRIYRNEKNCVTRFRCVFLKACASGKLIGYTKTHKLFTELE